MDWRFVDFPKRVRSRGTALACAALLAAAGMARAVEVRIATMNVCNISSNKAVTSLAEIVERVQPDILALQECSSALEQTLATMLATQTKPLPHRAFMQNPGTGRTTASGDKVAIFSAWPIAEAAIVKENYHDSDAVEFMRWPIHAKIEVPGALNPLHVVTLHASATTVSTPRRIWRGLEANRVREYVEEHILEADPNDVEYVVLGDFNDSAVGRWDNQGSASTFQPASFNYATFRKYETNGSFGAGANFVLGRDHPWYVTNAARESWTMPYRTYPTEHFGDVQAVETFQTGSTDDCWVTEWKNGIYRLDYILFSSEIMASSYGAPLGEVYHSLHDGPGVGLSKPGAVPSSGASTNASDHLLVFSDFHMIDEVGGLTPVAILSEVVHCAANPSANYVEICNTGNGPLDLSGYKLALYTNGSSRAASTYSLPAVTLPAGGVFWVAANTNDARTQWGSGPDGAWKALAKADGNDAIVLRNASGSVHDIYGAIGIDGNGKGWCYSNSVATRVPGITEPMTTWHAVEWSIAPADGASATPGTHQAVVEADASLTGVGVRAAERDSSAPLATEAFAFAATAVPNAAASNLAMTARFRVDGGSWLEGIAMTNAGGHAWLSEGLNVARSGGSVMDYQVLLSFDGPGDSSPVESSVLSYTFPADTSVHGLRDVLINEIATSAGGGNFVELVGGAGVDVTGWRLEWYDAAAACLWTNVLGGNSVVANGGFSDEWENPAGFFVVDTGDVPVGGTSPCILVLRNAAGAVVDAVALAATNEFVEMVMPDGLSTSVARGEGNFLHCLGPAAGGAGESLQAPNNVRTGCTASGLHALPDWTAAAATPDALNAGQTNACLAIARVDRDGDGVLDDADNCPADANTVQSDIDDDGVGDACDDDMDGDGIPNGIDNCPTEYNPRQEDYDGDGTGNACDADFDADAWEGRTESFWLTFEDVGKQGYASATVTDGGRDWTLTDVLVATNYVAGDRKLGHRCARFRNNGTLALEGMLTNGLSVLSFFRAPFGEDVAPDLVAETSTDGGATWQTNVCFAGGTATGLTYTVATGLGIPSGAMFRLRADGGSATNRVCIDNLLLVAEIDTAAACELAAEIEVEYDGEAHTNEFYVTPAGAAWSVGYRAEGTAESVAAPVAVGTYTATVSVGAGATWPAAEFVFPASVVITEVQLAPEIATDETLASAVAAVLSGNVVANSEHELSVIFEYGTSTAFGNKLWTGTVSGFEPCYVDCVLENLLPDTLYYWRLHVGSAVSEPRSFTTDSLERPVAELFGADASQALVSWDSIEGATNYVLNVWSIDGAGGVSNIDVTFRDWANQSSAAGYGLFGGSSASVKTQETAVGNWTFYGVTVTNAGSATGSGSQGYAAFESSSGWLRFPPLDGVSGISVVARSTRSSSTLKLQESTDGGATFSDVESFNLNATAASKGHAWPAGQAGGTVFRLLRSGRNTVNVHDIHVTVTAAAEVQLAGMPTNVAECAYMLENLAPSTTYYVTVRAQGHGWETEWSDPLELTTAAGAGSLPLVTLPDGIPGFPVGIEGNVEFAVSGDPQPVVTVGNESAAGAFSIAANDWNAETMSGSYTFSYRPADADGSDGDQVFAVTASNAFGVHSVNLPIHVQTHEEAFAQWLYDRFDATTNSMGFAATNDIDADGMTTWQEFLADTCPTDSSSRLKLELTSPPTATPAVFSFTPSTNRWYQLVWWTNLLSSNAVLNLGRPATTNAFRIETNLPPEWFGTIRSLLAPPSD